MKANEVLKILKVTRPTLCKYVREGKIKGVKKTNGLYDYDEDSVLAAANITATRSAVVYARVSTQKQRHDLENQIKTITDFANSNGYSIDRVYSDTASGLSYDRKSFLELLDRILNREIKTVFIKDKDRLTRVSFDMWKALFKRFNCELVVVNASTNGEQEEREIFSDIISLLHCFAMRMYSARGKKKITLIKEDLENEIGV